MLSHMYPSPVNWTGGIFVHEQVRALVALGHDVLAVDSSAEMLAAVRSARTHRARIEDLDLAERFDVVLLASNLVNTRTPRSAPPCWPPARRHLADDGRVLLQWHEPAWFDRLSPGARLDGAIGPLSSTLEVHDLAGMGAAGLRCLPPAPAESWAVGQRQR
jgi:hypothetical protein